MSCRIDLYLSNRQPVGQVSVVGHTVRLAVKKGHDCLNRALGQYLKGVLKSGVMMRGGGLCAGGDRIETCERIDCRNEHYWDCVCDDINRQDGFGGEGLIARKTFG